MLDTNHEQKTKEIEIKAITKGEKVVNKLLLDLGLDFIDCNITVQRNKKQVGEIDGLFKIKDDYLLILEIDDTKNEPSSKKIGEFYSKWSDKENIGIILDQYSIPREIKVIKVFISYENETPSGNLIKESLKHHFIDSTNQILYKDDIEYFQKSFSIIGKWAKNDLINFIGLHKKPTHMFSKPAIRVLIGNRKAYLFSATAYELLESCYVYRRRDKVQEGYQRILKEERINEIKQTIEGQTTITFPNSFIINSHNKLEENPGERTEICNIYFPTDYCSCRVVDGQHRLLGFANVDEKIQKDHNLPVVAFDDMDVIDEVRTFIAINTKQKSIDPNLLLVLKSDFNWPDNTKFFNEKQAVLVIKRLSDFENSPLYKKIFLGYNPPRSGKITLATLVSAILGNNLIVGNRHLLHKNIDDLDTPYKEIGGIFYEMQNNLSRYCNFNKMNQIEGFFFSNKGLRIVFRLIQLLIRNKNKNNIQIEYSELFKDLNKVINDEFVEDLQKYYGEGGATKATEELTKKLKKNMKKKYGKFKIDFKSI